MLDKLPEYIDPINSVNHNKQFVGRVNLSRLKRLGELTESSDQDVQVELNFYYDKALKFPAFIMKLEAVLNLQCQRSLKTFAYPIKSEVTGIFTESLALTKDLPAEIEVFELGEGKISSFNWIEEELLLSVPLAPINKTSSLNYQNTEVTTDDDSAQGLSAEKPNPFAMLQGLKK
ncbi:MAG: hypothetical protein ISEC1_P0150 [Thiomicrorhabdus sp.]|nr:MAG: hypothetical protein ISEC1_P0150 [Thiomicrorhabdus sp.]